MIPALCVLLGLAAGWVIRGWVDRGPRGYAVLCDDLDTAALCWRPGLRVYRLTAHGAAPLAEQDVSQALARLWDRKRSRPATMPPERR